MSRYGMKVADETVYGIQHPDEAIRLIEKIVDQYFGELWTQHKPRCPLCNEALSDVTKHMNTPVGECTNPKCDSTIHVADYLGKIKDILAEAAMERKQRTESQLPADAPKRNIPTGGTEILYDDEDVVEYGPFPDSTAGSTPSAGASHNDVAHGSTVAAPRSLKNIPEGNILIFVW